MADRDGERWYQNPWREGERWPSVTTILGAVANKPNLLEWRSREAARFAVDNFDTMFSLIAEGKDREAIELAAGEPDRIAERAADLGKLFHRLAEAEIKGEAATMTDEEAEAVAPFMESFHRFLEETKPTFRWAEATVYHQWAKYAGTTDGGVEFGVPVPVINSKGKLVDSFPPGSLLNTDWKTGRSVRVETVAQQVAYSTATHMGIKDQLNTVVPMPKVVGAAVVHIRPDGFRVHGVRVTPAARAAWEHAVAWFNWLRGEAAGDLGIGLRGFVDLHLDDLPGIDIRVRNALAMDGVRTLADLEAYGEVAFRAIKFAGAAGADRARGLLALEGREWATETTQERGAA
jgi:hypothetical protein